VLKTFVPGLVFGEVIGTGAPRILALHGWGRSRRDLAPLLEGRDGILVDLPGFGASPAPGAAWSTADYADALAPLLAEMAAPRTVVGHSFGGRVAVHLAARTDLVDRLILVGTPLLRPPARRPPAGYRALRWLTGHGVVPQSVLDRWRRRHGSADYNNASGVMRDVLVRSVNESYEEQLAAVDCPAFVICGEGDTAAPPEMTRRAAALMRRGTAVVVPGSAHLLDDGLFAEVGRRLAEDGAG
jgi:pimeloyl-ACP methyl ester carboxylesterase